jgi:hypothetical protein
MFHSHEVGLQFQTNQGKCAAVFGAFQLDCAEEFALVPGMVTVGRAYGFGQLRGDSFAQREFRRGQVPGHLDV